ncbi:hypothetical protein APA_4376 [Pseudanabaena sp. lw0831]|nr:hypothetical protein APA_4376 [Pseudanabaena sp. lw0831]
MSAIARRRRVTKNLKTTIPLYIAPKKAKNDQLLGQNLQT